MWKWITILSFVAVMTMTVIALRSHSHPLILPTIATTQPATKPTTAPAPVAARPPAAFYIDVVRSNNPAIPATQPLALPVDLSDAAHIILRDPVYLDGAGHLWITRTDAKPTDETLRHSMDASEHLIPDRPLFVHWWLNESGDWAAAVVTQNPAGGYDIILSLDRKHFFSDRHYFWDRAFSWDGKIVVPADLGISVFELNPQVTEHFHPLPGLESGGTAPVAILDSKGVLAWAPWDNGKKGSRGPSRFVDGQWLDLPSDQWPQKIIQLLPLLDGSILQIIAGEADKISLAIAPLESNDIDQHHVAELVDALADPDEDKRQAAFTELSRYGPGLWPILEKTNADAPPEAQIRIRQLLRNKITPALGGMSILENRLKVVSRQPDGTLLLFAPAGVKIPNGTQEAQTVIPAWIPVRNTGRVDAHSHRRLSPTKTPTTAASAPSEMTGSSPTLPAPEDFLATASSRSRPKPNANSISSSESIAAAAGCFPLTATP